MTHTTESAQEIYLNLRIDRQIRLSRIAGDTPHTAGSLDALVENDQDDVAIERWLRGEREEVTPL